MVFADRVHHLAPEGAYYMLARAQALEATGREIIHLEIGQPDVPTFENVAQAGIWAIQDLIHEHALSGGFLTISSVQSWSASCHWRLNRRSKRSPREQ